MEKLPLLRGHVTLSEALDEDDNMLAKIRYPQQRDDFLDHLLACKAEIEAVVSFTRQNSAPI